MRPMGLVDSLAIIRASVTEVMRHQITHVTPLDLTPRGIQRRAMSFAFHCKQRGKNSSTSGESEVMHLHANSESVGWNVC